MITTRLRGVVLGLLALMSTGCATTVDRLNQLDDTLTGYERAIRWGHLNLAASLHQPMLDEAQAKQLASLNDLRVSTYQVLNSQLDDKGKVLLQRVEIKYFFDADPLVRSQVVNQKWDYDEARKRWAISTPFPEFAQQ